MLSFIVLGPIVAGLHWTAVQYGEALSLIHICYTYWVVPKAVLTEIVTLQFTWQ